MRRDESNIFILASLSKGKKVHPFYLGFNFHLNSVCEHQPSDMSSSFILDSPPTAGHNFATVAMAPVFCVGVSFCTLV